jgi:hypothetical protein
MKDLKVISILETFQSGEIVGLMSLMLFKEALPPAKATVSYRESQSIHPGSAPHGSYFDVSKTRSRSFSSCSHISRGEDFILGKNAKWIEILVY